MITTTLAPFWPDEEMVGSDVWVDYFGTLVCYLQRSWSVKLAYSIFGVCVCVFFRAVEMGERDVSNSEVKTTKSD